VLVSLFSARVLREHMMPIVEKHTRVLLAIIEDAAAQHKPFGLNALLHRFTLDSFAEIGFGSELGSLKAGQDHAFGKALDDALEIAAARRMAPVWLWKAKRWLNIGSERQLREAVEAMDSLVMGIIAEAIAKQQQRGQEELEKRTERGIVSIILDRMRADGQPVEPSEIRSIALLSLIAGRDTTANAVSWLSCCRSFRSSQRRTTTCRRWRSYRICRTWRPWSARTCGFTRSSPPRLANVSGTRCSLTAPSSARGPFSACRTT